MGQGRVGPLKPPSLCILFSFMLQEKNVKHTGSISMSDVIEIARIMRPRSCAANLAGTCKEILGTAVSVGCKVDGKHPSAVIAAVSRSSLDTG